MRRQVEGSKPKPKPKPFYKRKPKTMKLEVVATPPVGRHRPLANGSSSAAMAPVALTQPTPNSEEPGFAPSGFPNQDDIFRLGDELQLRKPANLFAVHARLAGEGKRLQRPALG